MIKIVYQCITLFQLEKDDFYCNPIGINTDHVSLINPVEEDGIGLVRVECTGGSRSQLDFIGHSLEEIVDFFNYSLND